MRNLIVHLIAVSFSITVSCASAQTPVVLDDFTGGVISSKQPTSGGNGDTWYDSSVKSKGDPAASVTPIAGGMKISAGQELNGVYRIFEAAVELDGSWHVNCDVKVVEDGIAINEIHNFQIGVIVNGVHRDTGNTKIAPAAIYAETPAGYLTPADDSSKPIQSLRTQDFSANAGDDILISLGTDVTSGNFTENSGIWGESYILIDNIVLEPAGMPVSLSGFTLE